MLPIDRQHAEFGAAYVRCQFRHQAESPKHLLSFTVGVFSVFWIMTLVAGEFLKNAQGNIGLFLLFFFTGSALILKSTGPILTEANRQDNLFVLGLSVESRRSLYLYLNLYRLLLLLSVCLLCNLLSIVFVKPPLAATGYVSALMLSGFLAEAIWIRSRSRKSALKVVREEPFRKENRRGAARIGSIRFPGTHPALSLLFYHSLASFRRSPDPFYACFLALPAFFIFLRCSFPRQVSPALSILILALASIYLIIGLNRDVAEHGFWKSALPYSSRGFFAKNALFFTLVWGVLFLSGATTFLLPGFRAGEYLAGAAYSYSTGLALVWYVTDHHESPSHCVQVTTISGIFLFYLLLVFLQGGMPT